MRTRILLFCTTLSLFLLSYVNAQELDSYRSCAECHVQNVVDWKTSRHAMSTAQSNPFYAAMLEWANETTAGEAQEKCDVCHVPVKSLATTTGLRNSLADEGVTCDVCHATQPDGNWMKVNNSGIKYGPYKDAISIGHKSEYSKHLVSSDFCLTCHANLENEHGLAFCSTEKEYQTSSFRKMGVVCQDCHMPAVEGRTAELGKIRDIHSHKFYGGYNPEILFNCASLDLNVESEKNQLKVVVRVKNRTVGHALPTGSPMRSVYLSLKALDVDGNVVWENYTTNPLVEDPDAVFMRVLQNAEGQAPVPPWLATKVKFDQRLKPDETRELLYEIPGQNAATLIATLNYRLAPTVLLKKLDLDIEPYSSVVTIATANYNMADLSYPKK